MGTRTVRLEEDVYERVRSQKRDDETFSEAIDRLLTDYTLMDFARETGAEGAAAMDAALEQLDERGSEELDDLKR
jgi:predicted CopG family antitoxin